MSGLLFDDTASAGEMSSSIESQSSGQRPGIATGMRDFVSAAPIPDTGNSCDTLSDVAVNQQRRICGCVNVIGLTIDVLVRSRDPALSKGRHLIARIPEDDETIIRVRNVQQITMRKCQRIVS